MNPNSAPEPIDTLETTSTEKNPAPAKGWQKISWAAVLVLLVAPMVWTKMLFIVGWLFHLLGLQIYLLPAQYALAAVLAAGLVGRIMWVGLRRNWATSFVGWGLISSYLFVSGIVGFWVVFGVRTSSQDKAVMGNARHLAAAADQYFLENGVSTARLEDLVGATRYIKEMRTIAGEVYPNIYTQGLTITVTGVAGARTVTYAP